MESAGFPATKKSQRALTRRNADASRPVFSPAETRPVIRSGNDGAAIASARPPYPLLRAAPANGST
jgi:hypothetical protein